MTHQTSIPPLAVTMGEPSGIGGELTLRAWAARLSAGSGDNPVFFVLDDPERLQALSADLGLEIPIQPIDRPSDADRVFNRALPVLPITLPTSVKPGQPESQNASAIIESIQQATDYALAGQAGGVVTNPIHKAVLYAAGFSHAGHTEFLADICRRHGKTNCQAVMMLATSLVEPPLRIVLATVHVSLNKAITDLTTDRITAVALTTVKALREDFGIARPRLALAALNPHAGEDGTMGDEEQRIIQPAAEDLRRQGVDVTPPLSADTLFHPKQREQYDAVLCMYHDQGLIPVKTLDFSGGVNVTLGLPIIRTSPDHGPALDIAHSGRADPNSFLAALKTAGELSLRRRRQQQNLA